MRDRKLSRAEAMEEYLIYQIRLYEYLHMFQIALDIKDGKYNPENPMGHKNEDFVGTVRNACYGLFASLMDQDNHALDVFDVWRALFPEKEDAVVATWKRVEPHLQLIRDYRNDISFHANKNARRYFETRRRFFENRVEIMQAMQDFWNLAAQLMRHQITALPDFREEMKPILKAALPDWDDKQLGELTDYFVQSKTLPAAPAANE